MTKDFHPTNTFFYPRTRLSPYFEGTQAAGAKAYSVYNHIRNTFNRWDRNKKNYYNRCWHTTKYDCGNAKVFVFFIFNHRIPLIVHTPNCKEQLIGMDDRFFQLSKILNLNSLLVNL